MQNSAGVLSAICECSVLMAVGYLKEEGCIASYRLFLNEMRHLEEYRTSLEAGYEYPTNICGQSLKMILSDLDHTVGCGEYCLFSEQDHSIGGVCF